jgi:trans-AT polyketide synthase/acyltransferase/oxidoreductase domain-containing protein
LGTPAALAAAFVMGADFVMTGSINQCTVEAGTSDGAKDLLAAADIQDTAMAPAGDMFEIGAQVQVLRKGVLFPARANKLYELYRQHEAVDRINERTIRMIETRYLGRGIEEVWEETRRHYAQAAPEELAKAEANPKQKMAMIFRWYWIRANRLALGGDAGLTADYQIHCGPAMGAFNHWVKGTRYEDWRNRHVDEIADLLMRGAAGILNDRLTAMAETYEPAAAKVAEGG